MLMFAQDLSKQSAMVMCLHAGSPLGQKRHKRDVRRVANVANYAFSGLQNCARIIFETNVMSVQTKGFILLDSCLGL